MRALLQSAFHRCAELREHGASVRCIYFTSNMRAILIWCTFACLFTRRNWIERSRPTQSERRKNPIAYIVAASWSVDPANRAFSLFCSFRCGFFSTLGHFSLSLRFSASLSGIVFYSVNFTLFYGVEFSLSVMCCESCARIFPANRVSTRSTYLRARKQAFIYIYGVKRVK